MLGNPGYIYLVADGDDLVKIGFSSDPAQRIAALQVAHGRQLNRVAVVPGTVADEKALHARFAGKRQFGEWFTFDDELRAYARSLESSVREPALLSVRQVAERLGVSADSVYREIEARRFPHRRIRNAVRFTESDVAEYLERCRAAEPVLRAVSLPSRDEERGKRDRIIREVQR